jgi:type IV pilus assembly protein PilF
MKFINSVFIMNLLLIGCVASSQISKKTTARVNYDLGVAAFNRGDMRGALQELLKAEQSDASDPGVHHMLGLVYHSMGYPDKALVHYEKALSLKEIFSEAQNNYGILLMDIGRYHEAITAFQKALSDLLYPTPSLAEGNMGWAHYQLGETAQALKHIQHAVATSPSFCRGYQWLSRIYVDTKKPENVLKVYEKFMQHCVEDAAVAPHVHLSYRHEMMYYAGLAYVQQGLFEKASEVLKTCSKAPSEEEMSRKCSVMLHTLESVSETCMHWCWDIPNKESPTVGCKSWIQNMACALCWPKESVHPANVLRG